MFHKRIGVLHATFSRTAVVVAEAVATVDHSDFAGRHRIYSWELHGLAARSKSCVTLDPTGVAGPRTWYGVTAVDLDDALGLIRRFENEDGSRPMATLPPIAGLVEDVDVSTLDAGHVFSEHEPTQLARSVVSAVSYLRTP